MGGVLMSSIVFLIYLLELSTLYDTRGITDWIHMISAPRYFIKKLSKVHMISAPKHFE